MGSRPLLWDFSLADVVEVVDGEGTQSLGGSSVAAEDDDAPPVAVEPEIATEEPASEPPLPSHAPPADDPATISYARLLDERPDVLRAYYEAFYRDRDPHSAAWSERVGGTTPEAYAKYWYEQQGRYEGYNQGPTTAGDNVSLERILQERPDVLRAFYEEYYGAHNDRHSDAFAKRVGGETPEAYAKYWYEHYGKWSGYAQSDKAAAENVDVERLLVERPDVFRAFYEEYYSPHNDRHSSAWNDRVGGETVQDYAKYWYVTYGKDAGYSQAPANPEPSEAGSLQQPDVPAQEQTPDTPGVWPGDNDPSLDPWNHPAIYPDRRPPYEGWQPPTAGEASSDVANGVGRSLAEPDLVA